MSRGMIPNTPGFVLVAGLLALAAACGGPAQAPEAQTQAPTPAEEGASGGGEGERQVVSGDGEAEGAAAEAGGSAEGDKRKRCLRAIEHVVGLIEERGGELDRAHRQKAFGKGVDQCAADASRAELDCVLAAGALEDVERCEGGGG